MLSSESCGEGGGIIWLGQFLLPCDDTNCGRGFEGATLRVEDKGHYRNGSSHQVEDGWEKVQGGCKLFEKMTVLVDQAEI